MSMTLKVGETGRHDYGQPVSASSSDLSICTATHSGSLVIVKAVAVGSATVFVSGEKGFTATISVTVIA